MPSSLQLALLIAILLPATKIAASLCDRCGVPAILGELLVGVVAGPGVLNLLHLPCFRSGHAVDSLMLLAQLGGVVLMFIAGVETDVERMREAGGTAFLVAFSGVIWPLLLGAGAAHLLGISWRAAFFIGGALAATSVSISARTLMDAGKMVTREASVILGAAVIDDVMGLFVLAFLAASCSTGKGEAFGVAPYLSTYLQNHFGAAARFPLLVQMSCIALCVVVYFVLAYSGARSLLNPLIIRLRKLTANEAVPSCVLALVLVYAVSAEWMGSVAAITGAYLLGFTFAESQLKGDIERSFYSLGHAFFIPLFFASIGLASDFHALRGHWIMLGAIFVIAIVSKLLGCGSAALVGGMGFIPSVRVGCGMISRGEVGLIVTAMGAEAGIFQASEVAVLVAVVLLTTLITPLLLRAAFRMTYAQDDLESDELQLAATDEAISAFHATAGRSQ